MTVFIRLKKEADNCKEFKYSNVDIANPGGMVIIRDLKDSTLKFVCDISGIDMYFAY